MSDESKPKRGGKWKRPPTKVYAYNYDVGELYYKPMLNHLDKKSAGLETETPGPRTFAERLATDPLYNKTKPVNYVSSDIPQGRKEVAYDDEDRAFKKRMDDILGDYKDDEAPRRSERPDRFALPSLSDQILDSAGLSNKMRDSIDDRLAEARRRPFRQSPPPAEDIDTLLKKASANRAAALSEENFDRAIEESLSRRRNLLRDLNSELAKIDGEIEQYGSSSRQQSRALAAARSEAAAAESVMSSSARMSAASSTSLNVKQRRVKTTITTETVRS